jgi:hypothetical protein
MNLRDSVKFIGHFGIKIYKKDGSIEEYEDKNLIMDRARQNMAQLVGGVTGVDDTLDGQPINSFVMGTEGHVGDDILDYKKVGSDGFDSTRTNLFSEESDGEYYVIPFNASGTETINIVADECYNSKLVDTKETCNITRTVVDRTCTYIITVPDASANAADPNTSVIAYTEAALYSGTDIFSMKTFPARVKEDTVKFEITWSIIF